MFGGALSDKFGRKPLLIASGLLFVVTSLGTGMAPTFLLFVINRVLGGVAIGIASNLSSFYIAEVAPASMRGRLVATQSAHDCARSNAGADSELADRAAHAAGDDRHPDTFRLLERAIRMALDVRRHGSPRFSLPRVHDVCTGEPSLAGQENAMIDH